MASSLDKVLLREKTLMLGLVTSMVSAQSWQLIATYLAWPVSGTHTIISALMGFTLIEHGGKVIYFQYSVIYPGDQSWNVRQTK